MAKKNFFAVIFMMIAMVISFSACTEDGIADIDGDLTVDINGGENKPADPDTYELITEHVGAELAGNKILDDHDAILLKNDEEIERHAYVAEHEINVSEVTLKRAIAEELQNSTISYVDGKFDLAGTMMVATVTLQNCDKVYFNENGKTYCHSKFVEDGAVAALTCCTPQPSVLKVKNLNGNILYADMIITDHESLEYPIEIIVTDDDVIGAEFDDFKVTGKGTATINEYETLNGNRTGKVTVLDGSFEFVFNAGPEIVKISANQPSLVSNVIQVTENKSSFSYTLDGVSFIDNWTTEIPAEVTFTATDGSSFTVPLTDWTLTSLSFRQTANNVWANNAQLSVNGVPQADDTQIIRIEDLVGWETDDFATVTDRNTVSINAYETRNGVRTGRVETLTASYAANLTAGAIITKTSQDILRLVNTTATLSGSTASFSYVLGSESFEDKWNWSASSNATFTLPDGQQTTKPIKATYSVESTGLNNNGNVYSNAASLYAGTVEVANGVQLIRVSRPDIEGYEAISGFLTTWYRNINGALVSQGNIIVVNYRNISDKNKNILVVRDASNGQEIMRETANNIAAETILSVVYGNNGMSVATLIGVTSTNDQPKDWRYEAINSNAALTVDELAVVTQRLPNPYIAYATVENGGLKLGNLIFY